MRYLTITCNLLFETYYSCSLNKCEFFEVRGSICASDGSKVVVVDEDSSVDTSFNNKSIERNPKQASTSLVPKKNNTGAPLTKKKNTEEKKKNTEKKKKNPEEKKKSGDPAPHNRHSL